MLQLTREQSEHVLNDFQTNSTSSSHADVWTRRTYAPMYIYHPALASLRSRVESSFPEYIIAFDVVFDSDGNEVAWHCDYESLGPFHVPCRHRAMRDRHFVSIHFNLTLDGGSLVTYDGLILSYLHFLCIQYFGIFGLVHRMLNFLTRPWLLLGSRATHNTARTGNVFDNTRLHHVTRGAPRTSYVLRLVKCGNVALTKESVLDGIARSSACRVFSPLLRVVGCGRVDVNDVDWMAVLGEHG